MAEYLSERERRKIERQRRKEEEEERKLLEELDREMEENQEKAIRDLKLQQERIRRERREKLERRRELLQKQSQLKELEEQKTMMEEKLTLMDEHPVINEDVEGNHIDNVVPQSMVYDYALRDEDSGDERSEESNHSDSSYTTKDEEDNEQLVNLSSPKDNSTFIDSHQNKLKTIEREIQWLESKEKECELQNTEQIQHAGRRTSGHRQKDESFEMSRRNFTLRKQIEVRDKPIENSKYHIYDKDLKREDVTYKEDMEFNGEPDYDESPEEHKLKEQIGQLQTQKIKVEMR
ncbi:golgin subfamily A member 6-like protein 6 [Mercenaria mercenaria]|uniref:golgin subfamily A member 6-like protein 6 n=1 Tax=Mercenaria mercenaria TaxID=6596 RepID=UPI00234ECAE1|nr:golgin subfamily A member 6-like protein 6 [Mercenaria mercenaria]